MLKKFLNLKIINSIIKIIRNNNRFILVIKNSVKKKRLKNKGFSQTNKHKIINLNKLKIINLDKSFNKINNFKKNIFYKIFLNLRIRKNIIVFYSKSIFQ
jgi:hypothetical protein